eukprot:TRINITY_DN25061_c0_g1_i4.p3 TRINITY_DN25061_c0_g1~~TRINITY_DN25061_c0_g1_i4.p3  ORF type:complete len:232 (-),score=55.01 TRINITY_DN25061_c0_g1_i4:116-811(-)
MVRLICISDTHNGHDHLTTTLKNLHKSNSDILIHSGDMTDRGSVTELQAINSWFGTLPYKHKLAISGNMDGIGLQKMSKTQKQELLTNVTYLENESIQVEGLTFFGSPYTPRFCGGFQLKNDQEAADIWQEIPGATQILVVHGPPRGMMDVTSGGMRVGCPKLRERIGEMDQLQAVIWGHIHESAGVVKDDEKGVTFVNAAQYNGIYNGLQKVQPFVVEVSDNRINHTEEL